MVKNCSLDFFAGVVVDVVIATTGECCCTCCAVTTWKKSVDSGADVGEVGGLWCCDDVGEVGEVV